MGVNQMKRLLLSLLFLNLTTLPLANRYIGPYLSRLLVKDVFPNKKQFTSNDYHRLVLNKFPGRNTYQLRVLDQEVGTSTCGRHTIKNLLFGINALSQKNKMLLRKRLAPLLRNRPFKLLNRTLCAYLNIKQIYKRGTHSSEMVKAFNGITNGEFLKNYPRTKTLINKNIQNKANKIVKIPVGLDDSTKQSFDANSQKILFNNTFKNVAKRFAMLDNIYPNWVILKEAYNFRNSNQKIKGFTLDYTDKETNIRHFYGLIVRKVKNDFEYFILDSANLYSPYWLKSIRTMKLLMNMPLQKLKKFCALIDNNLPY
jgi:hypothetical protein